MNEKWQLEDVKLYFEEDDQGTKLGPFLNISYIVETDKDIRRMEYPKVDCFMYKDLPPHIKYIGNSTKPVIKMDFGFGERMLWETNGHFTYKETIIHVKTKKMTLEEIEEKLGHKIELVSNKED